MEKFEGIFLEVFTQESNYKSTVANTDRYKRICAALYAVVGSNEILKQRITF